MTVLASEGPTVADHRPDRNGALGRAIGPDRRRTLRQPPSDDGESVVMADGYDPAVIRRANADDYIF
jgi:hypothetical protein